MKDECEPEKNNTSENLNEDNNQDSMMKKGASR